jgi:O-acetyl-ADP-ribose deacetylase (regulator of RNase III)
MTRIYYLKGDIFNSQAQVIVNTVNCKGVMGKGLALAFKQRYPDMFLTYQQECKTGKLRIGRPTLYQKSSPWILNFPTKDHWKFPSKMEYIEKGLAYFAAHYREVGITSIAFPKLGAQNGKLSWDDVGPVMAKYLGALDIDIYIYIADGDREYQPDLPQTEQNAVKVWTLFNNVALSLEHLQQEVGLSHTDAKIVLGKRKLMDFTSTDDFNAANMKRLAECSRQKIKRYIDFQQSALVELPGIPSKQTDSIETRDQKISVFQQRKSNRRRPTSSSVATRMLFPL